MTPHVLIRPDHIVESAGFVGQQPVSFGQEGIVGGVSGNTMPSSDAVHGQVVVHERGCAALDRSWRQTCPQPVLIAAQTDPQDGEVSAERGMCQFTGHAVT